MNDIFNQSGFWVLAFMVSCAIIKLIGSLMLRKKVINVFEFVLKITKERKLEGSDKILLNSILDKKNYRYIWVIAPFSLFFFIAAIFMGLVVGNKKQQNNFSYEKQTEIEEERYNNLSAKILKDEIGIDPLNTNVWNDGVYHKLNDMVITMDFLKSPILSCFIFINAVLSLPFLLVAWLCSVPMYIIIDYLWWPLRVHLNPIKDKYIKLFT